MLALALLSRVRAWRVSRHAHSPGSLALHVSAEVTTALQLQAKFGA